MQSDASTPLMRQYHALKQQVPQALLMFRLGDFYELFYDDAVTAARELEITLTSRSKDKGQGIPMCGVPHHSSEGYIARLIQRGYRVAVCEQMEDPRFTKKLVKREIARIITPGTATESHLLRSHENNYLAAVALRNGRAGLAHVDVSTGEFRVTEVDAAEVAPALETLNVREVLTRRAHGCRSRVPADQARGMDLRSRLLRARTARAFQAAEPGWLRTGGKTARVGAAGADSALLARHAAKRARSSRPALLLRPLGRDGAGCGICSQSGTDRAVVCGGEPRIDTGQRSRSNLHGDGRPTAAVASAAASMTLSEIEARLEAVAQMASQTIERSEMQENARFGIWISSGCWRRSRSVRPVRAMCWRLAGRLRLFHRLRFSTGGSARLEEIAARLDPVDEVSSRILKAISDEPPVNLADGGTIRDGYHAELDELRDISRNSRQYIAQIESRERARTGIASLKVRFNNVFGYYIEISKANLQHAPADYERKQTLVNAERFTTPELKELEAKVLSAEEKILDLETADLR